MDAGPCSEKCWWRGDTGLEYYWSSDGNNLGPSKFKEVRNEEQKEQMNTADNRRSRDRKGWRSKVRSWVSKWWQWGGGVHGQQLLASS